MNEELELYMKINGLASNDLVGKKIYIIDSFINSILEQDVIEAEILQVEDANNGTYHILISQLNDAIVFKANYGVSWFFDRDQANLARIAAE